MCNRRGVVGVGILRRLSSVLHMRVASREAIVVSSGNTRLIPSDGDGEECRDHWMALGDFSFDKEYHLAGPHGALSRERHTLTHIL